MRGLVFIAALLCAAPASAQERPLLQDALAMSIKEAMKPAGYGNWAYQWDAVGIRMRHARWHLAPPDETTQSGVTVRSGWIESRGRQSDARVCGGAEEVMALAFKTNVMFGEDDTSDFIVQALRDAGGDVRLVSTRELNIDPEYPAAARRLETYAVSFPDREGSARMELSRGCTSPRSAAAQRCWTNYVVALPSWRDDALGQEVEQRCHVGRRDD